MLESNFIVESLINSSQIFLIADVKMLSNKL